MTVNERFQPSSMDLIRAGLQDLEASRRLFEQLKANGIPEDRLQAVLDSLTNACDPDTALTNLVAIVNAATGEALSGIMPDRQSFERMITVLGVSDAMGKLMRFHPDLVQAASSDADNTYLYNHAQRRASMLQAIGADPDELDAPVAGLELADAATALRGTYYRQLAAIMAQDATAPDPCIIQPTISRELSDLADSALEGALAIARHEVEGSDHVRFVIIGMGKLGAQELNYVSDVDLIYAVEPADDAIGNQELIRIGTKMGTTLQRVCQSVIMGVAAPAEHVLLLLGQQGENYLRQLRLPGGAHQGHRGPVQALSCGLAPGAQPGAHQQLIHRVAYMGQADGADAADLFRRQLHGKIISHGICSLMVSLRNISPWRPASCDRCGPPPAGAPTALPPPASPAAEAAPPETPPPPGTPRSAHREPA